MTTATEFQRRESLVMDIEFRKIAHKIAVQMGITAKEWNANKMSILMHIANEFCGIEDRQKSTN